MGHRGLTIATGLVVASGDSPPLTNRTECELRGRDPIPSWISGLGWRDRGLLNDPAARLAANKAASNLPACVISTELRRFSARLYWCWLIEKLAVGAAAPCSEKLPMAMPLKLPRTLRKRLRCATLGATSIGCMLPARLRGSKGPFLDTLALLPSGLCGPLPGAGLLLLAMRSCRRGEPVRVWHALSLRSGCASKNSGGKLSQLILS
mmetsp:Transcript_62655/g.110594  ORF Transcript_62655/g.110594 Transcript_62655/m.110594 type:complete len:207 (-) Transcript_62655:117-737(-)